MRTSRGRRTGRRRSPRIGSRLRLRPPSVPEAGPACPGAGVARTRRSVSMRTSGTRGVDRCGHPCRQGGLRLARLVGGDLPRRLRLVDARVARLHEGVGESLRRLPFRDRELRERLTCLPGGANVRLGDADVGRGRLEQRPLCGVAPVRGRGPAEAARAAPTTSVARGRVRGVFVNATSFEGLPAPPGNRARLRERFGSSKSSGRRCDLSFGACPRPPPRPGSSSSSRTR